MTAQGFDTMGTATIALGELLPTLTSEVRFDLPVGRRLSLGLRAGASMTVSLARLRAGVFQDVFANAKPDNRSTIEAGPLWSLPVSLAVRYQL